MQFVETPCKEVSYKAEIFLKFEWICVVYFLREWILFRCENDKILNFLDIHKYKVAIRIFISNGEWNFLKKTRSVRGDIYVSISRI